MKVLVTGSLGLTGAETMDYFQKKGWEVVGVDSNMRSYFFGTPKKEDKRTQDLDIRRQPEMDDLFHREKFDAIIHTAAQPSHDWSKKEPLTDFDINARGTLILLEATRKYCPEAVFVHVSTDKIYGEGMKRDYLLEKETRWHSDKPFDEDTPIKPSLSLFGVSKLCADYYVQEYAKQYGMKTVCFRPGCITGKKHEGAEQHGFLAYLAKCVREEKQYSIFGYKGKQVRDQIHAYDLAAAFYEFVDNPKVGAVYNIGGGEDRSVSVLEAIGVLEKLTGKKAKTEYVEDERFGDRIFDVHDVSRFRKDYPNWDYKYSLKDIFNDLI